MRFNHPGAQHGQGGLGPAGLIFYPVGTENLTNPHSYVRSLDAWDCVKIRSIWRLSTARVGGAFIIPPHSPPPPLRREASWGIFPPGTSFPRHNRFSSKAKCSQATARKRRYGRRTIRRLCRQCDHAVASIQQIIYCLLSPTVVMMTSDSRDMMSTKSYCTSFVFRHVFLNKIGVLWQQARGQPTIVETEMR